MFRFFNRGLLFYIVKITGIYYKSPSNLNYWYNFGFFSLYFLVSQLITGIVLAMFYCANVNLAFNLIIDMSNDIYSGWWIRYIHANGASFFFLVVYLHMCRGIYYNSFLYPRQALWLSGSVIWVLMIATAFLGYVLPWGQMSFWGAMVITSLLGTIPFIGNDILFYLWGGFSIDNITLMRFYSLHFALPFIILFLSILHLFLLHEYGSNNPLGISSNSDYIPFTAYYGLKDVSSLFALLGLFSYLVFFNPDYLGHSDNYIMANSLVTPAHIVPEWYFLPLYAVLRSVTNKLLGVALIALFILFIFFLPFLFRKSLIRSIYFKPFHSFFIWIFFMVCLLLGWIGGLPVIEPFLFIGQFLTVSYFLLLGFILPVLGKLENLIYKGYFLKNIK